jgi:predicted RecA/RadA family phage recombinase
MATIIDGVRHVRTLKLAHTAAVGAGEVIVFRGNVLVAINPAGLREVNVYAYRGRVAFPKGAGAIGSGVPVYWDEDAGQATTTESGNTRIGITTERATDVDNEVVASLHEN